MGRWQRELAEAIRDPEDLCQALGLDGGIMADVTTAAGFPLLVPRSFVARMARGDTRDPLLLQVLPQGQEAASPACWTGDPLGESESLVAPGLIRKYHGRALLLVTGGCAVNCRYCFRREFPYAESGATRRGISEGIAAIAEDQSITEVILSGGDPLLLDDDALADLVARLDAIPHLRRLRLHTRVPVVLPSRVTPGLRGVLGGSRLARTVVLHINHAAEIDDAVVEVIGRLAASPAIVLNQTVLLAGVNDSAEVLAALSERLVAAGVVPYYLHLLDRVRGAAHFEVPEQRAIEIHRRLRETLPGYLVPRLVREVPGERSKVWIA